MFAHRTPRPLRLAFATVVVVSLTGAGPLGLSGTAVAAPAKYADDFNGDGYRDYAQASLGGYFTVTYGTATGPGTVTKEFTQNSPGIPGKAGDAGGYADAFGEDLAVADFNQDGYADLAVSDFTEKVSGKVSSGAVTIMWGAKSGLGTKATRLPVGAVTHRSFGKAIEAGDFNGDGKPDLAVVDSFGTVYIFRGGFSKTGTTGKVTKHHLPAGSRDILEPTGLVAGKVTKDKATDLYVLGQGYRDNKMTQDAWFLRGGATIKPAAKVTRINNTAPDYGPTGVIADFDKDGYGDLAVRDVRHNQGAGSVVVVRGGASGPTTTYRLTQSTPGVATSATKNDYFGAELSAGDTNRDGYPDLAVSAPSEKVGSAKEAGGVHILRGGKKGLTGAGSQWFTRATAGIPGSPTAYQRFGLNLRLRDIDRDGYADLLIGDNDHEHSLFLRGGSAGITTTGVTRVGVWPSFPQ
ncbi:FG-GAP and VCBS repeat-containing protein [Streptomyces paludis]|uniref:Integrin-like protein n=1 Tax=Streptomyces paludis TaxID=2282738 RepID=A0A345HNU7_9ACTN|nr:FG-GAP and VCBS repeat-containing protein [Streptomyces paludis]AXG78371.1 integrin-like protein [Streptomyces paludis]